MADLAGVSGVDPMALMPPTFSLSGKMAGFAHDPAKIDKTAKEFEAMFATEMLQPMFKGVKVDGLFGGGHGEEIMRVFLLREYGKILADDGRLGIAAHVKAEMLKAQEGNDRPAGLAARNAYVKGGSYGANG